VPGRLRCGGLLLIPERPLPCRTERQHHTFSNRDVDCNYALNIYDAGNTLSVVVDAGEGAARGKRGACSIAFRALPPQGHVLHKCAAEICSKLRVCLSTCLQVPMAPTWRASRRHTSPRTPAAMAWRQARAPASHACQLQLLLGVALSEHLWCATVAAVAGGQAVCAAG